MKLFNEKHKDLYVNVYHINKGLLKTKQTYVYKTFMGIPYKIINEYRVTLYDQIIEKPIKYHKIPN